MGRGGAGGEGAGAEGRRVHASAEGGSAGWVAGVQVSPACSVRESGDVADHVDCDPWLGLAFGLGLGLGFGLGPGLGLGLGLGLGFGLGFGLGLGLG